MSFYAHILFTNTEIVLRESSVGQAVRAAPQGFPPRALEPLTTARSTRVGAICACGGRMALRPFLRAACAQHVPIVTLRPRAS